MIKIIDESRPKDSNRIMNDRPEDFDRKMRQAYYALNDLKKFRLSVSEYKMIDKACDLIISANESRKNRTRSV